jgi:hypothetical protein
VHTEITLLGSTAGDVDETCWPLSEKQRTILRINRYELASMMDIDSLLPVLYTSKCLTEVHIDCIRGEKSLLNRNFRFLEILSKRSQANYFIVISVLNEIGQGHLANILSEDGGGM